LGAPVTIGAGATVSITDYLFAGAKEVDRIDAYQEALGIDRFDRLIDWGWFYFLTRPMFWGLDFFFGLFGNFGVAILAVTVVVKLFFFPLQNKAYASMSKMKLVQPQMMEIREKFGDDRQKQQQALMELYKKEKINPVSGCLPVLIQIPVFFALYKVLFVTLEMRHAPFFGWIEDLSAPDPTSIFNLFGLLPYDVPGFLLIGVWPLLMGITMFLQMRLNPLPADPIQQTIFTWMPVVFTFMLAGFPAGLVIYWAWNNTLTFAQQWFIMKRNGVEVDIWGNVKESFKRPKPGSGQTAGEKAATKAVEKKVAETKPETVAEPANEDSPEASTPPPTAQKSQPKAKARRQPKSKAQPKTSPKGQPKPDPAE
ncbi:MAG: membrane protein insertase YidC, partial [Pseudomonadota bacterium]